MAHRTYDIERSSPAIVNKYENVRQHLRVHSHQVHDLSDRVKSTLAAREK